MPDQPLTAHAQKMLGIITARADWTSRAMIARALGKRRLTPYDVQLLEDMTARNLIETRQRESNTPIGTAYEYKVKS